MIGLSELSLPLFGGTLVPAIDHLVPFTTDSAGSTAAQLTVPPSIPSGTQVWIQSWILDATAPDLVAGSNAVTQTSP